MLQITKGQQFPVQLTVMRTQDTVTTQFLLAGCIDLCFNVVGKQRQYALDGFTFKDNVLTATVNTAQLDEGVYTLTARGRYMGEWWRAVTVPLFEVVAAGGVLPTEPVTAQSTAVFSIHQEMTGALARIDALEQKPEGEKVPTEMKLYFKAWNLYKKYTWSDVSTKTTGARLYYEAIKELLADGSCTGHQIQESMFFSDGAFLWKKLKEAGKVSSDTSQEADEMSVEQYRMWVSGLSSIVFPTELDAVGGKYSCPYFYCLNVGGNSRVWDQFQSKTYSDAVTWGLEFVSFRYMTMDGWDLSSFCYERLSGMWSALKCIFAPNISDDRLEQFLGSEKQGTWQRIGEFYIRTDVNWGL